MHQSIRRVHQTPFELSERRRLTFYAAVWDTPAVVYDIGPDRKTRIKFRERIKPGAFTKALADPGEIVADIDHDKSRVFAKRSEGLILQEDGHGLFCSCWVPETEFGDMILRDVAAGKLTGCSFDGDYFPSTDVWRTGDGMPECDVTEVFKLADVCLTGNPAYRDTDVIVRTAGKDKTRTVLSLYQFQKLKLGR